MATNRKLLLIFVVAPALAFAALAITALIFPSWMSALTAGISSMRDLDDSSTGKSARPLICDSRKEYVRAQSFCVGRQKTLM